MSGQTIVAPKHAQRVAVLGAGRWGRNLVRGFGKLGVLRGIVDPEPRILDEMRSSYPDAWVSADMERAFGPGIDAVAIATPASTHANLTLQALAAGKDVFVEKPLAMTSADAGRMVGAAEADGLVLMAGHLLLYQPAIEFLHGYLNTGSIGKVVSLHQDRLNLGTVRTAENALWSLGVHDIAAILHLIGEDAIEVEAWGQRVLQPRIEDDVRLNMRFGGNREAHVHASWLWPERRRRLTIVGTDAMIVYDEEDQRVVLRRCHVVSDLTVEDEGSEVLFNGDPRPLKRELSHFLECVRDRTEPLSSGASAIPVVRVLEQASQQLKVRSEGRL